MKFCIECGSKLPEGAKFCGECGTRVGGDNSKDKSGLMEKANAVCKKLLDPSRESIHSDRITAEMFPMIKEAADGGNGLAAYIMGQLYFLGLKIGGETVVAHDPDKMLEYYRKGAEAGDPFAQSEYGQQLCNGVIGSSEHDDGDDAAGYPWIAKAGKNGNVSALHRMTYAYLDGSYGQEVDFKKALECFEAIVKAKDSYDWPEEMIVRAKGYLKFLPKIISDDDIEAMRNLGEWLKKREGSWDYTWGLGDAVDESEFWLKKAQEIDYDTDYADEEDDEDEVVEEDDEDSAEEGNDD